MASIMRQIYGAKSAYEEVKSFIQYHLTIKNTTCYQGEKAVEKEMVKQMIETFGSENVNSQYAVGGFLNLKCDIDVYDGQCGIELKVAKQLNNATALQRVIGQLVYYSQRRYKNTGLILLVVGTQPELNAKMKELRDYVELIPNVHFIYKQAMKK